MSSVAVYLKFLAGRLFNKLRFGPKADETSVAKSLQSRSRLSRHDDPERLGPLSPAPNCVVFASLSVRL